MSGITARRLLGLISLFCLARPAAAQTYTWVGPSGNIWQNPTAWNPVGIPGAANDVVFTDAGAGVLNLPNSAGARSLTFDTTTGSYGLTFLPPNNQTFFGLTAITIAATDTAAQGINLIGAINGTLAFPGTGPGALTITNNSVVTANPTLIIGSRGIGTTGDNTAGITFTGAGYTNFNTPFIGAGGSSNPVTGGLTKTGPGTLALTSDASPLQGAVTLAGGTMLLDYSGDTSNKLGAGGAGALVGLALSGGTLNLKSNASTNVTQTVGTGSVAGTGIDTAHTDIRFTTNGTGTVTLNLTSLLRFAGSTLDVFTPSGFAVQTTNSLTNGILGGWATTGGGSNWATTGGPTIVPLTATSPNNYGSGYNTDVTSSYAVSATTNSLRYTAPGVTTTLNGTLTLQSGGILVPNYVGPTTINGDGYALASSSSTGELIVHTYSDLTINDCARNASGGLTKTGFGTLTLGGNFNSATSGTINVNQGNLRVTSTNALATLSIIRFNDNRYGFGQNLIFQLPDGQNPYTSAGIVLRGGYIADYYFQTTIDNQTENSRITMSGAIGSATAGTATPLNFAGVADNTSGFTLTGTNTFSGNVRLSNGDLGITSNAALGDVGNTLMLAVGSFSAGGLELLNGGINLTRPVSVVSPTRILNYGTDVDTISGGISGSYLVKDGSGTLVLTGTNTAVFQISAGTLNVGSAANLGSNTLYLAGGTLAFTGIASVPNAVRLGPSNGAGTAAIDVAAGQTVTMSGSFFDNGNANGGLLKTGAGALSLTYPGNAYTGGTTVQQGILQVAVDGSLGAAGSQVTIGPLGTLLYANSVPTGRTFNINGGTLSVAAGQMLTFSGATVGGGFLRGPGTFSVTGGSTLTGAQTPPGTILNVTGAASFVNFSNAGTFTVGPGLAGPITLDSFTNQGAGGMTIGAGTTMNVSDFQSYGQLTLTPATGSPATRLNNSGTTPMYFNGGSRTFIGTPQTAGQNLALVDLHGQNAVVAGGLFVNNGFVGDSTSGGATIVADFGSLVKGAGTYANPVITQNGGKFQAGNSPGVASFGRFIFGPGGVDNYVFAIDDATGAAGPRPDVLGHVSGWSLVRSVRESVTGVMPGDFTWTATRADKLTLSLDTLINPTTVGSDVPGPMAYFDPTKAYSWPAVEWAGVYTGPADAAALSASTVFDTTDFANPTNGEFGWRLDLAGHTLSIVYTPSPVPEPSSLSLLVISGTAVIIARRYRKRTNSPSGK